MTAFSSPTRLRGRTLASDDPDDCVDCDACVHECPVEAIYYEENVPPEWKDYIALNAEMSRVCPPITERKEPLAKQ